MGSTPGSCEGGNTGSLGCQGGVSRAGFGVSPGRGAGGWKGPPGLGLCWFKSSPPWPAAANAAWPTCASERLSHVKKVSPVKKGGYGFRQDAPAAESSRSCAPAGSPRSSCQIPAPKSPVSSRHPASRRSRGQDRQSADYPRRHSTQAGCAMSSTDFLFCLHKLLAWLFAFLSALLPQHLIAQLSAMEVSPVAHAPRSQLYAQAAVPPRELDRVALPRSKEAEADARAAKKR